MKYVYASLMAVIGIILLLSNNTIKVGFERVFAYGGGGPITVTGGKVQVSA